MGMISDSKTVGELRKEINCNRYVMLGFWLLLLADRLIVHGWLRDEQQNAIQVSKEVIQKAESLRLKDRKIEEEMLILKENFLEHTHYYNGKPK